VCILLAIGAVGFSITSPTHTVVRTVTVTVPGGASIGATSTSVVSPGSVTATYGQGYGMLRVTSDPALQTTVLVNDIRRDDGGLNWVKLAPGTYKVRFTDVPGYASPPEQTVTVNKNANTTVVGKFTQLGYLHVITNPALPGTIYVDGHARDDSGLWAPLNPGQHTVHFGDVANYTTPADEVVNVVAGETATVTGNYVPGANPGPSGFGYLHVITDPALGSTIYVNNVPMDDLALNWVKLDPGAYTVHFSDLPGYISPPDQTVTVTAGEGTDVTGKFTQAGYLHVTTDCPVAPTIYVEGNAMDEGGIWVALQPGTYTVSFGDVEGYTTASPQTVTVTSGQTTTVAGGYVAT